MDDSKRAEPVVVVYKGFRIEAYESDPGRWRVRITRADGAKIKTVTGEFDELKPAREFLTAETAIEWQKGIVHAGGMSKAPELGEE